MGRNTMAKKQSKHKENKNFILDWFYIIMSLLMLSLSAMCIYVLMLFLEWRFFFWQLFLAPSVALISSLVLAVLFLWKSFPSENRPCLEILEDHLVVYGGPYRKEKLLPFSELRDVKIYGRTLFAYTNRPETQLQLNLNLLKPEDEELVLKALREALKKKLNHPGNSNLSYQNPYSPKRTSGKQG